MLSLSSSRISVIQDFFFLFDEVTRLSPEKSELSLQPCWIYLESESLQVLFILGYFKTLSWGIDRVEGAPENSLGSTYHLFASLFCSNPHFL